MLKTITLLARAESYLCHLEFLKTVSTKNENLQTDEKSRARRLILSDSRLPRPLRFVGKALDSLEKVHPQITSAMFQTTITEKHDTDSTTQNSASFMGRKHSTFLLS